MSSTLHTLTIVVSLMSVSAMAQDLQSDATQDAMQTAPSESASAGGESVGADQGGFMGFGQKKMQRVKALPLPSSRSSRPLIASAQTAGMRDVNPSFPMKRSKPALGELSTDFPARMVYLNGRNISTVREQQLDGVSVRIDAHGNLHISAPHYEVQDSTHYRPLLPRDIPRVSKPAPQVDEPLLSRGRFSKSPAGGEGSNLSAPNAVPPVEADEEGEGSDQSSVSAPKPAMPSAGTTKPAAQ